MLKIIVIDVLFFVKGISGIRPLFAPFTLDILYVPCYYSNLSCYYSSKRILIFVAMRKYLAATSAIGGLRYLGLY